MFYNSNNKSKDLPIVFEFGSFHTRIGYAGSDKPFKMTRTEALFYEENNETKVNLDNLLFFSKNNNARNYRVENNFLEHQNYEKFLIYFSTLLKYNKLNLENKTIFIIEPPNNDPVFKIRFTETLFEDYKISGVAFYDSASTASFLHYKKNSLVVDIGGYNSYFTPIYEGQIIESASMHIKTGGEKLTEQLCDFMENKQNNIFNYNFFLNNEIPQNLMKNAKMNFIRDIKHACLKIPIYGINNFDFNPVVDNFIFESAQKHNVILGRECYSISETLFEDKTFEGLKFYLKNCIEKIENKEILNNIIIAGGTTNIPNFIDRLQKEIIELLGEKNNLYKIKCFMCNSKIDKINTSWIGGSILSTSDDFQQLVMTRNEYNEHGSLLIEKKTI